MLSLYFWVCGNFWNNVCLQGIIPLSQNLSFGTSASVRNVTLCPPSLSMMVFSLAWDLGSEVYLYVQLPCCFWKTIYCSRPSLLLSTPSSVIFPFLVYGLVHMIKVIKALLSGQRTCGQTGSFDFSFIQRVFKIWYNAMNCR